MKSVLLISLLFSSFSAFGAKEIELKRCSSTFKIDIESQYSLGYRQALDITANLKVVQIKKALQKNINFVVDFTISKKSEDGSYSSNISGSTPSFRALNGAVRENLSEKSSNINSVEKFILKIKKSIEKDVSETGESLESIELGEIKSATVYPVNAFQDEEINLIDAKDTSGNTIATILTFDDAVVLCK